MAKQILIVDDEASIRKLFERALKQKEYQIDTAASGEEGLKMARKQSYHLIFLDIVLPGINGILTLKRLREIDELVPVYFMTGFFKEHFDELKYLSEKEGFQFEVIQKPLSIDQIRRVTEGILGSER